MEEKKMKSPPLTTFERGVLLQLVKQKEHIIENKRTDAVTVAQKKRGWTEISREFCSTANTTPRSGRQLKKCWLNLKQRARKERLIKELQATGGVQSCARPDPFIQIPDSLLPHANFNCSSQLSSNNFVRDDEVMNVVGFDSVCIKEERQKDLLQEEPQPEWEDFQKQKGPLEQQQCQQETEKSSLPQPQRQQCEFRRQPRIPRNPEEVPSDCQKTVFKHYEKCACELHKLRMKYEEEKLQTEREFREEKLHTERVLREARRQTEFELRDKQLQTEDMRQKHLAELHELEIKERMLKIQFLKERLGKN